jgi:hypothetical protein
MEPFKRLLAAAAMTWLTQYAHATQQDLQTFLQPFTKPQQNLVSMTAQLRPEPADYAAVFKPEAAKRAQEAYQALWTTQQVALDPGANHTEVLVYSATAEDIRAWRGAAAEWLPGGYKQLGGAFKDGVTVYRVKFTEPGKKEGMAYDALIFVNGHWRWFPKPYSVLNQP